MSDHFKKFACWFRGHKPGKVTETPGPYNERWNGHIMFRATCLRCERPVERIFVWCEIGCSGSDWKVDRYPHA